MSDPTVEPSNENIGHESKDRVSQIEERLMSLERTVRLNAIEERISELEEKACAEDCPDDSYREGEGLIGLAARACRIAE